MHREFIMNTVGGVSKTRGTCAATLKPDLHLEYNGACGAQAKMIYELVRVLPPDLLSVFQRLTAVS